MKLFTIQAAADLTKAHGARGAIVIMFSNEGAFGVTSWGRTRRDCRGLGRLVDVMVESLQNGELPSPLEER